MKTTRKIIKVDGTEIKLHRKKTMDEIKKLIGGQFIYAISLNGLHRPHAMICDDIDDWETMILFNEKATEIAHKYMRNINHKIYGDVVIVPSSDVIGTRYI